MEKGLGFNLGMTLIGILSYSGSTSLKVYDLNFFTIFMQLVNHWSTARIRSVNPKGAESNSLTNLLDKGLAI